MDIVSITTPPGIVDRWRNGIHSSKATDWFLCIASFSSTNNIFLPSASFPVSPPPQYGRACDTPRGGTQLGKEAHYELARSTTTEPVGYVVEQLFLGEKPNGTTIAGAPRH